MKIDYVIFFGPYVVAGLVLLVALVIWHRNLGPTPSVWVLLSCAAVLIAFGLYLPIGIWLGDR